MVKNVLRRKLAVSYTHLDVYKRQGSSGVPVDRLREPPLYTQGVLRVVSCAMFNPCLLYTSRCV